MITFALLEKGFQDAAKE